MKSDDTPPFARRMGRPPAAEARQKPDAILIAARDLFSREGYRAVSMNRIAEAAQVSSRTLYKHYADKLSLCVACLDMGVVHFPRIARQGDEAPNVTLERFAIALVEMLSSETSLRMSVLVYREGGELPELVEAAERNQYRHLVLPLAEFLRAAGLAGDDAEEMARLFNTMALFPWQGAINFNHPLPSAQATAHHAALVAQIFVDGLAARQRRATVGS